MSKSKLPVKHEAAKSTRVATKNTVSFMFGITGESPETKRVATGSTVGDIVKKLSLQGMRMLVNGERAENNYALREGDTLTAATPVKGGK